MDPIRHGADRPENHPILTHPYLQTAAPQFASKVELRILFPEASEIARADILECV